MANTLSGTDALLLEHLAYEDGRIGTRLNPDTLIEKVNLFRPRMIEAATARETITYGALTNDFHDLAWEDIGHVLGLIGLLEDERGRPLLPAVVVNAGSDPSPGENYFALVEKAAGYGDAPPESDADRRREVWRAHVHEVWEFDW